MPQAEPDKTQNLERRAMIVGMAGNLVMCGLGLYAGYLSHSQAIQLDGLFSLIGFAAAYLGLRVAQRIARGPDKFRPYGYAADEAIFVTFRALALFGLVLFAMINAVLNILGHFDGTPRPSLNPGPMLPYFTAVGTLCTALFGFHRWCWIRTDRKSGLLRLESQAAAFDGLVTAAAAVGLLGIGYYSNGLLAPIAPIGDSLVVLILCVTVLAQYFRDFLAGLAELAGVTAQPQEIASARRAIRDTLEKDGGVLRDLTLTKTGRSYLAVVYYDPTRPVRAEEMDHLTKTLNLDVAANLTGAELCLVVTQTDRTAQMQGST
ncbi:cation transporter [Ruegeria marisrubri]|uniref:cation transporter n=1 Tax=Ruegeria marisrubri TaxID=1685379 RepID=UPI001CD3DB35|nr:cation transporter [Ruegeria marisrubri]MCA0905705.1 cation transporter [Ruegeria marisrubri]